MLLLSLKRTIILGVPLGVLVCVFWANPEGWVLLVPVLAGIKNNWNTPTRVTVTPTGFLADWWIFVFAGDIISSSLLVTVPECCCRSLRENWKQNRSSLMRASSWFCSILQSMRKNMIPDSLYCSLSNFISTLPEALRNYDAESLSTPNALSITFVICFSEYFNAGYVYFGNLLSMRVIKSDTLWPPLR